MNTEAKLNEIFKDLLAQLGHLSVQRDELESQITALKQQLNMLNSLAPELKKLEATKKESN